ncbi:MAG: class I SAM-dependent methyltransferase [Anaerolineales bacterium]
MRPGDGAGPGRFTQVLSGLGAKVWVSDVSPTQIKLNETYAHQHEFAQAVQDWQVADICDLHLYKDQQFDHVVAYGGPLSYVLDQRDQALSECLRVLQPGGKLLLSVMSLWGTIRSALIGVVRDISIETNRKVIASGNLIPETFDNRGHYLHMFQAQELRSWLHDNRVEILDMAASHALSLNYNEPLAEVRQDEEKWTFLLEMELEASAQPGAWDLGTHLLAVVQKSV